MAKVVAKEGESLESMCRRFKRKVENEGIIEALRDEEFYVSPKKKKALKKEKSFRRKMLLEQKFKKD